jgi:hypothetical protein
MSILFSPAAAMKKRFAQLPASSLTLDIFIREVLPAKSTGGWKSRAA